MGLNDNLSNGQTPLDEDEIEGLLVHSITLQRELNEFEQSNIQQAIHWTLQRRFQFEYILTEEFIKLIHKKMYGDVWNWAGQFRKTNKNIGVEWQHIPVELKNLLDDCKWWVKNNTYSPDEIAIRFKHRLVSIHCFSNGNGRHSRFMADLIIEKVFGKSVFSWRKGSNRDEYILALKAADENNLDLLLKFARS